MPVLVPVVAPSCGKTLAQRRLGLEAEVGIDRRSLLFANTYTMFPARFKHFLAYVE